MRCPSSHNADIRQRQRPHPLMLSWEAWRRRRSRREVRLEEGELGGEGEDGGRGHGAEDWGEETAGGRGGGERDGDVVRGASEECRFSRY